MKIQVVVKTSIKAAIAEKPMTVTVGPAETVASFIDRIGIATNTICFPDPQLCFKQQELPMKQRVSACGIRDGDLLELVVQASDDILAKQLVDILGNKAMSTEELGLLYTYRNQVPVQAALQILGFGKGKFKDFLNEKKCFSLEGDTVKATCKDEPAQIPRSSPAYNIVEVKTEVEVHVPGKAVKCMTCDDEDEDLNVVHVDLLQTVGEVKAIISASEQMPFPETTLMLAGAQLQDGSKLFEAGVQKGDTLSLVVHASEDALAAQLECFLKDRVALSSNELSMHYCQRFGASINKALRILGLPPSINRFLESQLRFSVNGGCVTLANGPTMVIPARKEAQLIPTIDEAGSICCH